MKSPQEIAAAIAQGGANAVNVTEAMAELAKADNRESLEQVAVEYRLLKGSDAPTSAFGGLATLLKRASKGPDKKPTLTYSFSNKKSPLTGLRTFSVSVIDFEAPTPDVSKARRAAISALIKAYGYDMPKACCEALIPMAENVQTEDDTNLLALGELEEHYSEGDTETAE